MRWSGLAVTALLGLASLASLASRAPLALASPRSSNPAFLGIRMNDASSHGPCMIESATPESPAEAAGLRGGDLVIALDSKPIATCAELLDEITARVPGDLVQIKLRRASSSMIAKVALTTRDALLHKVVGRPMVATQLIGVEDGTRYDLSALQGRSAIVGLYNPACVDCASLFTRFQDWARDRARAGGAQALVLAVSAGDRRRDLEALQKSLDVPLATGELVAPGQDRDRSPLGLELVISDRERLGVIVIDGRGIVQYVGPIAPNGDDRDAVLDELFAAADQTSRRSR